MIHGYLSDHDRAVLQRYASGRKRLADVGCHRGLSSVTLARTSAEDAIVYAVDPHAEFTGMNGVKFGPGDRAMFYRNVQAYADRIALIGLPSVKAAMAFDGDSLDFAFIDGDHQNVLLDVQAWFPKLQPDAMMLFHDIDLEPVQHAVKWICDSGDAALVETAGNIAVVQKHGQRLTHIADGREIVFIHVPKTGGTSVWFHVAKPDGIPTNITHWRAVDWRQYMGVGRFDAAFKFAVIRDPYDRLISSWTYMHSQTPDHRWWFSDEQERNYILSLGDTFEEFIENAPATLPGMVSVAPHFVSQSAFVTVKDTLVTDYLLPFDGLNDAWDGFMDLIGDGPRSLPHSNRTVGPRTPIVLSQSTKDKIHALYGLDFQLYDIALNSVTKE